MGHIEVHRFSWLNFEDGCSCVLVSCPGNLFVNHLRLESVNPFHFVFNNLPLLPLLPWQSGPLHGHELQEGGHLGLFQEVFGHRGGAGVDPLRDPEGDRHDVPALASSHAQLVGGPGDARAQRDPQPHQARRAHLRLLHRHHQPQGGQTRQRGLWGREESPATAL